MEELEKILKREEELAESLKSVCTVYGDEAISKLRESSLILFRMGTLYLEKAKITCGMDQKTNFVKCAVLLHGARVRYETYLNDYGMVEKTVKILKELDKVLLETCHASLTSESLFEESKSVIQQLKLFREVEKVTLSQMQLISDDISDSVRIEKENEMIDNVSKLLQKNTHNFKNVMQFISAKCVILLGDAPCSFSLVGLGSLAREEVSLYSDFEHVIVLEDAVESMPNYESEIKEYFRWFAVLFQVIIVGLGETFIRSIGIQSLNDLHSTDKSKNWFFDMFTPVGVSFDGQVPHSCNNPLGRQAPTKNRKHIVELIQPAHVMASYLTNEEHIKNGYYLKDLMVRTCLVYGDIEVYSEFRRHCEIILQNETTDDLLDFFIPLIQNNVNKGVAGCIYLNLKHFDAKKWLYRPLTALLSWCARIHGFVSGSTFEYLRKYKHMFEGEAFRAVSLALATACQVRANIYAKGGHQRQKISSCDVSEYILDKYLKHSRWAICILVNFFVQWTNGLPNDSRIESIPYGELPELFPKNIEILEKKLEKKIHFCIDSIVREQLVEMYLEKSYLPEKEDEYCTKAQRLVDFDEDTYEQKTDREILLSQRNLLGIYGIRNNWQDIINFTEYWFMQPYSESMRDEDEFMLFMTFLAVNRLMKPHKALDYMKMTLQNRDYYYVSLALRFFKARVMVDDGDVKGAQEAFCNIVKLCESAAYNGQSAHRVPIFLLHTFDIQISLLLAGDASNTMRLLIRFYETSMDNFPNQHKTLVQCYLRLAVVQELFDEQIECILCAIKLCQKKEHVPECENEYSCAVALLLASTPDAKSLWNYKEYVLCIPGSVSSKPWLKRKIVYFLNKLLWNYSIFLSGGSYIPHYKEIADIFACFVSYLSHPCFSKWIYFAAEAINNVTHVREANMQPVEYMNKHYAFLLRERKSRYNPCDPAVMVSAAHRRVVRNIQNPEEVESDIQSIWHVLHNNKTTKVTRKKTCHFLLHLVLVKQYFHILNCMSPRYSAFMARNSLSPNYNKSEEFNTSLELFATHRFTSSPRIFWKIIINSKPNTHQHRRSIQMLFNVIHIAFQKDVSNDIAFLSQEQKQLSSDLLFYGVIKV